MCSRCGWSDLLDAWEGRREAPSYAWASSTVIGILDWVEEHEHVTEKQRGTLAGIHERVLNPPARVRKEHPWHR